MRINVRPSDIDISNGLCGSDLGNSEKETIACNVISISQQQGDGWFSFTWDTYVAACSHEVTMGERDILDAFVEEGLLSFSTPPGRHRCLSDRYSVQDAFIAKLWKFVKAPSK